MLKSSLPILTVVPLSRPVKSRVTPEGTATAERMMVEQEVFDLLANEAPLEPEKVHVVALFWMSGAAVGAGAAIGLASTAVPHNASVRAREEAREGILVEVN